MARRLVATVVGGAAALGAGSLLVANGVTSGGGGRAGMVALYVVFLAATLALLAGGIVWSEKAIDQLAAARATRPRRVWRARAARAGRRAGAAARSGARLAGRGARVVGGRVETAVVTAVQEGMTSERRHAFLRALGLEEIEPPDTTAPRGRYASAHARRRAQPQSAITRRYNALEARRGTRARGTRTGARS
jgi:hypothetical protein